MMMKRRCLVPATGVAIAAILFVSGLSLSAVKYQKPPKPVLDVLDAPRIPVAFPSPSGDLLLLAAEVPYPPITDLAKPMLRLAGLRVDPTTHGVHHAPYWSGLTIKKISTGAETKVDLPKGARPADMVWSPDGKLFAFTNTTPTGIELWIGTAASGQARRINGVQLNGAFGPAELPRQPPSTVAAGGRSGDADDPSHSPIRWMSDSRSLVLKALPSDLGPPPAAPEAPEGPDVQESSGGAGPSSTYDVRDVLKNPHHEDLFDYYARSQLALVDVSTGAVSALGKPSVIEHFSPSPDGQYILVERIHRPYSYLHSFERFPKEVEIWSRSGDLVHKLASLPLADQVPIRGVRMGPRDYGWRPNEQASLLWAEALDGGNPRRNVSHRDQVRVLKAPFSGKPTDVFKTEQRFIRALGTEKGSLALVTERDISRHWERVFLADMKRSPVTLQLLWEVSSDEHYKDPGSFVLRSLPTSGRTVRQDGDWIYLSGSGGSPEGERPFLDRFNLRTHKTERLFRCDKSSYEHFSAFVDSSKGEFVTRRESPTEPPNYFLRTLSTPSQLKTEPGEALVPSDIRPITKFPDPAPALRRIKKQLVQYKRPDGVDLSFTVYLPPDYKAGKRLPTMFNAYPRDYTEADVAGQVRGSPHRFSLFQGPSHLFFALAGYAVLDEVAMPIVGPSLTAYDHYMEQLVTDAKAGVEKAVEIGIADPERIGVMGHSHGSLMVANLLAHCNLFRAGIARSGAHNKSLTMFGFQNERRTLWEARDTYVKVSPLFFADKIKDPILIIHGEADINPGTIPLQSERLYQAVRGTGGTARLVMLPFESHHYDARESVEHTLYEMISWFDRYVKNALPRGQKLTGVPSQN